ncbi:MAG: type II/IV secretion system protein, partial [Candidatus Omnitrophica bacterium]|nr:type II/IV secretion system protein [Candidatus Omnitrophota bacterium]
TENKKIYVALADPLDMHKIDDLKLLLDTEIEAVLSYEEDILESINKYYGVGAEILEDIMARTDMEDKMKFRRSTIEDLESAVEDASIIKFVNHIFTQAIEDRATDIHLEPFEDELRIRFRIDGFLYEIPIPESLRLFHQAIVSRIKVMANLDIAEHRLPQDGRIKIKIKADELDFRVSVLPSYLGEAVQVRILSSTSLLSLERLGFDDDDLPKIQELINKAHGIIFVTGPTGSGKSTSLYSCLSKRNLPGIKIITTEDPVEYQIRGITQIQIQPKIGLNFAACLRSILRHDPDIVMVGEVRDVETAEITIRSAMTGHLVFSTLHTNDAPSAPIRLIDMGIEPFLVASSLEGVIAQRLVRVICSECKQKSRTSSEPFKEQGLDIKDDFVDIYQGKGCEACRFTGYRGRTAIFEILMINEDIRNLILHKATSQAIKEKAVQSGMYSLRQSGLKKVLAGITTLSEVIRVS